MTEVLYRKLRPQRFADVVGQEAVKTTLKNAVSSGSVAHAYLLTGPRGVGKTSLARILAKALNCTNLSGGEPCGECGSCTAVKAGNFLDLIEIDAASNTGVDNIREIIEHVKFSPSAGRRKVIVIDEVHMLTKGAFNALLKTLEEPPEHAVFILATTELGKVPATIISRTQRFDFKRLSQAEIVGQLRVAAKSLDLAAPDEVLDLIARASEGGMRDALSLIDQLASYTQGELTLEAAEAALGLSPFSLNQDFFEFFAGHDAAGAIAFLKKLYESGRDVSQFANTFLEYLNMLLLIAIQGEAAASVDRFGLTKEDYARASQHARAWSTPDLARLIDRALHAAGRIRSSPIPHLPLQLLVAEFLAPDESAQKPRAEESEPARDRRPPPAAGAKIAAEHSPSNPGKTAPADRPPMNAVMDFSAEINRKWNDFLSKVRDYNHSLISSLKLAQMIGSNGDEVVLAFPYRFHKDAVEQRKNKLVIEKVLEDVYGRPLRLVCKMTHEIDLPAAPAAEAAAAAPSGNLVDEAMRVFGSASQ